MKYLFILGRNVELSSAEIFSYFERENIKIISKKEKKNSILIEVNKKLKDNIIKDFGGVIAIGKILYFINEIEEKQIYLGTKNKFNYVVWNFSNQEQFHKASDLLKQNFKSEKLKATEKRISDFMKLQGGRTAMNLSSGKIIDEQYFVFEDSFGKIIEKADYKEIEKRDMEKPVRREELSISPRLAKIMINLSQIKSGQKLVDCFCGIGTILIEALIQNIQVIGIDKDADAIEGARKNLREFSGQDYLLIKKNSSKVKIKDANVLVCEPDLGQILRKIPTKEEAEKTLRNYENLMVKVLNNLQKAISGRIVFTSPLIKQNKQRLDINIKYILGKTGLKLVKGFPISEFRENQIVGRNIFVLEK